MGNIDLNAARRARAEAGIERHTLTIDDEELELPLELPVELIEAVVRAQSGDVAAFQDAMVAVFGEETYGRLRSAHRLSIEDLVFAMETAMDLYGVTMGESPASPPSSPSTTAPSRPTSDASTPSTSETPSPAETQS